MDPIEKGWDGDKYQRMHNELWRVPRLVIGIFFTATAVATLLFGWLDYMQMTAR